MISPIDGRADPIATEEVLVLGVDDKRVRPCLVVVIEVANGGRTDERVPRRRNLEGHSFVRPRATTGEKRSPHPPWAARSPFSMVANTITDWHGGETLSAKD